jgi:hypothetical protein
MDWIKSLLKRKKKIKKNMSEQIETIHPEVTRAKEDLYGYSFKWASGEQSGSITDVQDVIFDDSVGITWVYFTDGTRINYLIIDEFMIRMDSNEAKEISSRLNEQTINSAIDQQTRKNRNIQVMGDLIDSVNVIHESPIRSLLQKQKPNWIDVSFKLKLNLPSKNLYDVLNGSFEGADEEIINFVVDDMDLDIIKEALRKNIREIYKKNGTERRNPVQEDDIRE